MPVAFPSIKPTERDYLPPEYAVTSTRSQSGVISKRLWGSAPGNAEITLGFRVISTDRSADILAAYDATKSGIDYLVLPAAVLSGVGPRLAQIILPPNGTLRWTFGERPAIGFVGPVWSSARVRLVGELRLS
jgi:hypothetical protein